MILLAQIVAEVHAGAPTDYYPWFWIGGVFVCLVALVMGANSIDDFLDRRKPKPGAPPNESLQIALSNLTRDVDALRETLKEHMVLNHHEHEGIHKKIGGVERGAQAKLEAAIASGNDSRQKLHERINTLSPVMGELRGEMQSLSRQLNALQQSKK